MVDDEVANTCLMTNFLNRLGYKNVESVNHPRLLFDKLRECKPALVLLDLMMPDIDGFQVLELMRKEGGEISHTPVIVITGEATAANKRRALAAGATDLLPKPVDASEANMRIRNVIEARLLQLQIEEHNKLLEQRVEERTAQLQHALDDLQTAQRQMLENERLNAFAQMAAGVVHDFSNALMSVIGYSDILLAADGRLLEDRPCTLEYLRIINTAGRDASEVVSRLRDFYRPRHSADTFDTVDLGEVIQQAVMMAQPKWNSRAPAAAITVETCIDDAPHVRGNASEVRELLTNLMFNAADAMPDGGTLTVRAASVDDGAAVLEVADSGTGMSPEVRARCLDPFFSTKGDHGTGLGLPMVFGIVKRHQGTLDIDTEPGRGTTFRIQFPPAASPSPEENAAPVAAELEKTAA